MPEGGPIPEQRNALLRSNCFAKYDHEVRFGAYFRRAAEASCRTSLHSFESEDCQGSSSVIRSDFIYVTPDEWFSAGGVAAPEGRSAQLDLFCEAWYAWPIPFLMDHAFVGPADLVVQIPAMSATGVLVMLLLVVASGVLLLLRR